MAMTREQIQAKIDQLEHDRTQIVADYQQRVNVLVQAGELASILITGHIDTLKQMLPAEPIDIPVNEVTRGEIDFNELVSSLAPGSNSSNSVSSISSNGAHPSAPARPRRPRKPKTQS